MTLSLCMIVRNEERTLGRILAAAKQFCDEMIVVDTGSTDRTVEIAEAHGAKVHHFEWIDDFAAARNFSFSKATGDWIIWLDADDVLPDSTIEIGKTIASKFLPSTDKDVLRCPYEYFYTEDGKTGIAHNRERFLRRSRNFQWIGVVHECIDGIGSSWVTCPEFVVSHQPAQEDTARKKGRNLAIYDAKLDPVTASARDMYLMGNELQMAGRFPEAIRAYELQIEKWPAAARDLFQQDYMVRIDLVRCYRAMGDMPKAIEWAGVAIGYDARRAEAYGLMGITHFELGNYEAAFPLFLAAAACKIPTHGGVVYAQFYGEHIHTMIKECKIALGHPPMQETLPTTMVE